MFLFRGFVCGQLRSIANLKSLDKKENLLGQKSAVLLAGTKYKTDL